MSPLVTKRPDAPGQNILFLLFNDLKLALISALEPALVSKMKEILK
jgi:hypothetical protein